MSRIYPAFWGGRAAAYVGVVIRIRMHRRQVIYFSFALILISACLVQATTVQRLSLEDMTKKSNSIVLGRVRASRVYWSGNVILTTTTINVTETIKGQVSRDIEVTTVGGTVGDTTLHVSGMPAFQSGEDAVVFVEKSGVFSTVVGLAQGKFTVDNGEVANTVTDLQFPDGNGGRPLKMPLEIFRKQLKSIIEAQQP